MNVSVVIPTYNNAHLVSGVLESLIVQRTKESLSYEVLVVDNHSEDQTKQMIMSFRNKFNNNLRYLFEPMRGIAHARNKGIEEAKGKYVLFIDDDCVSYENWITIMYETFCHYNADVVQGKVEFGTNIPPDCPYDHQFLRERFAYVDYFDKVTRLTDQDTVTANLGVRRDVLIKFGGFNPSKDFYYCEDTELSMRLIRANLSRYYCPNAIVKHHFELDRLSDEKFYLQSYHWGKGAILMEERSLPSWKLWCYCVKEILKRYGLLFKQYLCNENREAFYNRCKISSLLGRCVQLMKGSKA